jgi:hypothetical protein
LPKILFDLVGAGVWDVDRGRSRAAGDHHGRMAAVVLRLAYLGVTNGFAMLRLLPRSDRDKDLEILALRHQITELERQR